MHNPRRIIQLRVSPKGGSVRTTKSYLHFSRLGGRKVSIKSTRVSLLSYDLGPPNPIPIPFEFTPPHVFLLLVCIIVQHADTTLRGRGRVAPIQMTAPENLGLSYTYTILPFRRDGCVFSASWLHSMPPTY